jgi:metal-responsive CopG/Arc/MetJ family transcriptional regulator
MASTVKVAVSLPKEEFRAVEKARKKLGRSRSSLVAEAIRTWLEEQKNQEEVHRYIAGYKRHPETAEELMEAAAIGEKIIELSEEGEG